MNCVQLLPSSIPNSQHRRLPYTVTHVCHLFVSLTLSRFDYGGATLTCLHARLTESRHAVGGSVLWVTQVRTRDSTSIRLALISCSETYDVS